jgi:O-methyltransferase
MTEQVAFSGVKQTLVYTLYFRALDNRSQTPIVGDRWAAGVLRQIETAVRRSTMKARLGAAGRFTPLLRARRLDDWTRAFLTAHPDATVLHLACGLDSRTFRVGPPDGVRWYDLDYPDVIELRERLYPERGTGRYETIAASVTDPDWLERIPADGPVLVVAEGLLMYLTESELRRLLDRLTGHFRYGELAFDAISPAMSRSYKLFTWHLRDPRDIERWNPHLTLVEEVPVVSDFARIPFRSYRAAFRLMNMSSAGRNAMRLLRFRFDRRSG